MRQDFWLTETIFYLLRLASKCFSSILWIFSVRKNFKRLCESRLKSAFSILMPECSIHIFHVVLTADFSFPLPLKSHSNVRISSTCRTCMHGYETLAAYYSSILLLLPMKLNRDFPRGNNNPCFMFMYV